MKKFYIFVIALYSTFSFSQSPELFDETWYLNKLVLNGIDSFPPVNATLPYVALEFTQENSILTSVCNTGFGDVSFPGEGIFSLDFFAVTLSFCMDDTNNLFDALYMGNYYQGNSTNPFTYSIIAGENGLNQLTIINSQNDEAIYFNQNLVTPFFEKKDWSFYPNPTKDLLYFKRESIQKADVEIYDVLGKLCIKKTIDTNNKSVTTEGLIKGVYLIKITNETETFSSKFIKE